MCEQKSVDKKIITESNLRNSNKNGFGNAVGSVTNRCTGMYDTLSKFNLGSKEYNEMMYRIICMQGYQQEVIDSIKGIVPKDVPKHWYNYKDFVDNEEDSDETKKFKEENRELGSFKKPYFFIYNYSHILSKYNKFVKDNNANAIMRFRLTVEELRANILDETTYDINNDESIELWTEKCNFLLWYDRLLPVSAEPSTMNRICWILEEEFKGLSIHSRKNDFDSNLLMTNKNIAKSTKDIVSKLYKEYKKGTSEIRQSNSLMTYDNQKAEVSLYVIAFSEKLISACSNEEDISNAMINLFYKDTSSKQLIWEVCGEHIIKHLLSINNNSYNIISKLNEETEIKWNGDYYEVKNIVISNKEEKTC